jgi:hypothetical protein
MEREEIERIMYKMAEIQVKQFYKKNKKLMDALAKS